MNTDSMPRIDGKDQVEFEQKSQIVIMVLNESRFFLSHRAHLAKQVAAKGYSVYIATPEDEEADKVKREGFTHIPIKLSRWGLNPFQEFLTLVELYLLYKRCKPSLVHHVTIKAILYGSVAARLASVPAVVNSVSGFGYIYLSRGIVASIRRLIVRALYRFALSYKNCRVIFQNRDDREYFLTRKFVRNNQCMIIPGAGVDVNIYSAYPLPSHPPKILMVSRLLTDKGVREFVSAACIIRNRGIEAEFTLVGDIPEGNPAAIDPRELVRWKMENCIHFVGRKSELVEYYRNCHVFCLPSYREGLPKASLEAMASGRAIVTTDVPGCRETVDSGINGFLVPVCDENLLAEALITLIKDPELTKRMGKASEKKFRCGGYDQESIVKRTLEVYKEAIGISK